MKKIINLLYIIIILLLLMISCKNKKNTDFADIEPEDRLLIMKFYTLGNVINKFSDNKHFSKYEQDELNSRINDIFTEEFKNKLLEWINSRNIMNNYYVLLFKDLDKTRIYSVELLNEEPGRKLYNIYVTSKHYSQPGENLIGLDTIYSKYRIKNYDIIGLRSKIKKEQKKKDCILEITSYENHNFNLVKKGSRFFISDIKISINYSVAKIK